MGSPSMVGFLSCLFHSLLLLLFLHQHLFKHDGRRRRFTELRAVIDIAAPDSVSVIEKSNIRLEDTGQHGERATAVVTPFKCVNTQR